MGALRAIEGSAEPAGGNSSLRRVQPIDNFKSISRASSIGTKGQLAWIPVHSLYIDPIYQREVLHKGRTNIQQIVANFDWSLFSPLIVANRGPDCYAVVDGQHRSIAAITHGGITEVPCLVISGDVTAEARAFALINGGVTAVSSMQLHAAAIIAGDKDALEIQRVCREADVEICRYPIPANLMKAGQTLAVDAVKKAIRFRGAEATVAALRSVTKSAAKGNVGFVRSPIIAGAAQEYAKRPSATQRQSEQKIFRAIANAGGIPELFKLASQDKILNGGTITSFYAHRFGKVLSAAGF